MQRANVVRPHNQDLNETISIVKKEVYRKALREAQSPEALNAVERQVMADFQLTQSDRIQLLGEIEHTAASVERWSRQGVPANTARGDGTRAS